MPSMPLRPAALTLLISLAGCSTTSPSYDLRSIGYYETFGTCWYSTKGPIGLDDPTEHGTARELGEAAAGAWRIRPVWWEDGEIGRLPAGAWDELEYRLQLNPDGEVTLFGGVSGPSSCAETAIVVPLQVWLRSADGVVQGESGGGGLSMWGTSSHERSISAWFELTAWPQELWTLAETQVPHTLSGFDVLLYGLAAEDGTISLEAQEVVEGYGNVGLAGLYYGAWAGREVAQ